MFIKYDLIDPGSTGTYIVDWYVLAFPQLENCQRIKLDVQFLSLSRFLSVSATSFDIAPFADNDNKFCVQHAFSTPYINIPPADTTELTVKPASSVTPPETNLPPRSTCFSSLPLNYHHNQLLPTFWNNTGMLKNSL